MKKQIIISLLTVFGLILLLAGIKSVQIAKAISQNSNFSPPPEAVTSIIAEEQIWQTTFTAVGTVNPVQGVIISAEEPGEVVKIHVNSGAKVNQGDLLIELDTSVEEGNLKAAQARVDLALRNFDRMQKLKASSAVSRGDVDSATAALDQASGEVAALKGLIAKKKIAAPFSGTLGIRTVNIGQYLQAGAEIVPLYDLASVYIDFALPQQSISKVNTGFKINFVSDSYPGEIFEAEITAINPQIDTATRTIKMQAEAKNESNKLRPGMFVKVEVPIEDKNSFITIPASSVSFAPYGNFVFVIEKMQDIKNQEYLGVRQQNVEVGAKRGEQIAIVKGLSKGEEVVTSGVFKLRTGAAVFVDNSYAPGNETAVSLPNT